MPKTIILLIFAIVLVLITAFVFWFKKPENSVIEERRQQRVVPTTVSKETSEVDLPNNFPIFPGSTITDSWTKDTKETSGSSFVLQTTASRPEVYEFYKNNLQNNGWTIESEDLENFVMNIAAEKIQGFLVLSDTEEEETLISLTFAKIKDE